MPLTAMIFGVLMTALGIGLYVLSGGVSPTALIPSAFGAVLVVLGLIAWNGGEKARMHTMHLAAMIGLIGLVMGIVLTVIDAMRIGTDNPPSDLAMAGKALYGLLSAVFLVLCIRSFIAARVARRSQDAVRS